MDGIMQQEPNIIRIYSTYTPAQKACIQRYRSTDNGRMRNREAVRRFYARKKAMKLAGEEAEPEAPSVEL